MTSIKVIKYFIKSSPVGELQDVLEDITSVTGSNDFLQNTEIKDALREYYETHKMHIKVGENYTAMVSGHSR